MQDLEQLADWAGALLAGLGPVERRRLMLDIGRELRRSQAARIRDQKDPEGHPFEPRRGQAQGPSSGRVRSKMFERLRRFEHFRVIAAGDGVAVGFAGRAGRIARVHHEGLHDEVRPGGLSVRYPERRLLGFSTEERERVVDVLLTHLNSRTF